MPPQRAQIQAVINPPQQVIGQDVRFRAHAPSVLAVREQGAESCVAHMR
jgi:hypothetical protein